MVNLWTVKENSSVSSLFRSSLAVFVPRVFHSVCMLKVSKREIIIEGDLKERKKERKKGKIMAQRTEFDQESCQHG